MKIKKPDLIFIIILCLTGILLSTLIHLPRSGSGNYVEIRSDGKVLHTYPLSTDRTEHIRTGYGVNIFYIKEKTVYMKDADCPDKVCVKMHGISKTGETIVCLPHRLVLEIINKEEAAPLDAVTGGKP